MSYLHPSSVGLQHREENERISPLSRSKDGIARVWDCNSLPATDVERLAKVQRRNCPRAGLLPQNSSTNANVQKDQKAHLSDSGIAMKDIHLNEKQKRKCTPIPQKFIRCR